MSTGRPCTTSAAVRDRPCWGSPLRCHRPEPSTRCDMDENTVRAMIKDHFAASTDDIARASELYPDDAVLEFPQGRERIRGRADIIAFRSAYPARVTFEIHRTIGRLDLWVNEYTIRYDDTQPLNVVGIMEFRD